MTIPPERRAALKILPPELVAALNQPGSDTERRALINRVVADEIVRVQALRYVEELRLAEQTNDATATRGEVSDDDPTTP